MIRIALTTWIANAAAGLAGSHGDVAEQARAAGCSRQTVYEHADKVSRAVADAHDGGPARDAWRERAQVLEHENAQLWDWLGQTIDFPEARRRQFIVTAAALGLSLDQIGILLALVLGALACPARSTLHRIVQEAERLAGTVLKRLDQACQSLVLIACLDEIFASGKPILMGVEPASLTWFVGLKAADCQGATQVATLRPWTALEATVADAGSGLQAGLATLDAERKAEGRPGLDNSLDVFHTIREAKSVLNRSWQEVERAWETAEAAEAKEGRTGRQGKDRRGPAGLARFRWKQVERALTRHERAESAWKTIHPALGLFTPDGQLNDRATAAATITAALPDLAGEAWKKVRNLLSRPGALTFLDRLHRELAEAEPDPERRDALVRLWWLRRQRPSPKATTVQGAGHVAHLVHMTWCQATWPDWRAAYLRIAAVLRGTVRASSAAEGLNSVVRMHQARHRTLNQGLIDLKRLYWNCHRFRGGRRRKRCPYELLGLNLPHYDFWRLLQDVPAEAA